jgi:hypothetical protein
MFYARKWAFFKKCKNVVTKKGLATLAQRAKGWGQ